MRRILFTTLLTQKYTNSYLNCNLQLSSSYLSKIIKSSPYKKYQSQRSMSMSKATEEDSNIMTNLLKNKKYILSDGGTGEELFRRGVPDDRKIWSATAVVNEKYHSILNDVHVSFLDAGSDMITTNSYGIIPSVGFSKDEIEKYVALSGKIALDSTTKASRQSSSPFIVCGSMGPLVESYRPDLIMDHDSGVEYYKIIVNALSPYVDAYLAETMSSVEEASQALDAISQLHSSSAAKDNAAMVSFTINEKGDLRNGKDVVPSLRSLIKYANDREVRLQALLFNCAVPEAITRAFEKINANKPLKDLLNDNDIVLGAYGK